MPTAQRARSVAPRSSALGAAVRRKCPGVRHRGAGLGHAAQTTACATPGSCTYTVPAGRAQVTVVLTGAGGAAGSWDSVPGGGGAPGTAFTATINVQGSGAETIVVVVGEGGGGGNANQTGTPAPVLKAHVLDAQDATCGIPASGGAGSGNLPGIDGGGGGGYGSTAGAGGSHGPDYVSVAQSGGSGASCPLSAGTFWVSVAAPAGAGAAGAVVGPTTFGVAQPAGAHGQVVLTALAAPAAVPILGHLALAMLAGGMGLAAAWRRRRAG